MMKRIVILLLCLVMLVPLVSCTKEYVLVEGASVQHDRGEYVYRVSLTKELAFETYNAIYPTKDTVLYFPQSGEFETKSGEKFTAEIGEQYLVFFGEDTTFSRICFDVTIYNENGEAIVAKKMFQSYVQAGTKKLDLSYVSEEFRPYWEAIAIRSDKMN